MLTLAIDTSTKDGSIAVLRDDAVVRCSTSCVGERHSATLLADLDILLAELGLRLQDFGLFAVASGPGSFTGLRIGLTAGKAWAEVFDRPIVAVSTLQAIAVQALTLAPSSTEFAIAAVQDARRGQVFGGLYEYVADSPYVLVPLVEEVVLGASEFMELLAAGAGAREVVLVTPALDSIQPAVEASARKLARVERVSGVLAPFIGRLGYARAMRGEVVDALHLDANYVRRTDAELKWKD